MTKPNKLIPSIDVLKIGIEAIQDMQRLEEKWDKTFQEMYNGNSVPSYFDIPINAICKIIEKTYNDEPGQHGSHISWWIWEADYGKNKAAANSVMDTETGEKIPMSTIEDVYNYYVKYHFKGED